MVRVALQFRPRADSAHADGPVVICVETDRYAGVPGFESWWEVPVAEISVDPSVQRARETFLANRRSQRQYLRTP